MKRYGVLQTISTSNRRETDRLLYEPARGFVVIFKWPYVGGINLLIEKISRMHHSKIWEILTEESARGFDSVHFAILDYLSAENNLSLDIVSHEHRSLQEQGQEPRDIYETILTADWNQTKPPKK